MSLFVFVLHSAYLNTLETNENLQKGNIDKLRSPINKKRYQVEIQKMQRTMIKAIVLL